MKRHLLLTCSLKGESRAVAECRKHMLWYLKGIRGSKKFKIIISTLETCDEVIKLLDEIKETCDG